MHRMIRRIIRFAAAGLLATAATAAQSSDIVGTIPGSFSVSDAGSSSYAIPIMVAPGTSGMAPKLVLTYDSQSGGGFLGAGWSLTGLSVITRGPKTIAEDGKVGGVNLDDSDALYLDGARLIPISSSGNGAARVIEFRKESDDLTRIREFGSSLANAKFEVDTKAGLRLIFDGSNGSNIKFSDGIILLFAESRTEDTVGNFIEFSYSQRSEADYHVDSIRYTGHSSDRRPFASIDFNYNHIPTSRQIYANGHLISTDIQLQSITSRVSDKPDNEGGTWNTIAKYVFDYSTVQTLNRFVLSKVHMFAGQNGDEVRPTAFSYSSPVMGWKDAGYSINIPANAVKKNYAAGYRFGHVTSPIPKLPDVLFAQSIGGQVVSWALKNTGGNWVSADEFKPPIAFSADDGTDFGVITEDIDGSGNISILQSYAQDGQSDQTAEFLAGPGGWSPASSYKLPFIVSKNGKRTGHYIFARFSGSRAPDLIYDDGVHSGMVLNTGTGWTAPLAKYALPLPLDDNTRAIDVDADGKPELVYATATGWKIYRFAVSGWVEVGDPAFQLPFASSISWDAVRLIDLNGDHFPDLIISSVKDNLHEAFIASSHGWVRAPNDKIPPFDLVDASGNASGAVVADVNGDGLSDIVASKKLTAGSIQFTYVQTSTGWRNATELLVPGVISSSDPSAAAGPAYVGDVNGDGREDIIVPTPDRFGFGTVYQSTLAGFVVNLGLAPPIAVAHLDQHDSGVRFIDLNGDGLPDILYNREAIVNGSVVSTVGAFINTGSGWVADAGLQPPKPFASDTISGNPVQFVDVDGDGFVDMLYSYQRADGTVDSAYYHNEADGAGRKWVLKPGDPYTPPVPFSQQGVGDLGVRFVDLNGDGRTDMIGGVVEPKTGNPVTDALKQCPPGAAPHCQLNRSRFKGMAWLNEGGSWKSAPNFASPVPFVSRSAGATTPSEDLFVQIADVDGDGLPDLVAWFKHPDDATLDVRETWRNTGSGWSLDTARFAPTPLDASRRDPRALLQWVDLNGDGLLDIVSTERAGGTNNSATWMSTGRGFILSTARQIPLNAIADRGGDPSYRLVDVNGDGLPDILYSRSVAGGAIERGVYINDGSTWVSQDPSAASSVPAFIDSDGNDLGVRLIDVDGNGLVDVLQSYDSDNSGTVTTQQITINSGRRADVLSKIQSGYSASVAINYQTLLEHSPPSGATPLWTQLYEPGPLTTYPEIAAVPVRYVVDHTVEDDGSGSLTGLSYRYGALRIDATLMRSLGFGWRETFNERTHLLARTEFDQDPSRAGRPVREALCEIKIQNRPAGEMAPLDNLCPAQAPAGYSWVRPISESDNQWSTLKGPVGDQILGVRNVFHVLLRGHKSTIYEVDGGLVSQDSTVFAYDDDQAPNLLLGHENATIIKTSRMDGSGLQIQNTYDDDPAAWLLGRLVKSDSTIIGDQIQPGQPARKQLTRQAEFTYDSMTGLVTSETVEPSDPQSVKIIYSRDNFGNITQTTSRAAGASDRITKTHYDDGGRFAVGTENSFGVLSSIIPDYVSGLPATVSDNQNNATGYTYDSLGRTIYTVSPSSVATKVEYLLPGDYTDQTALAGLKAAYIVKTTTSSSNAGSGNLPPKIEIYDGAGRLVRTVVDGFLSNVGTYRPAQRDFKYDADGHPIGSSVPYDRGSVPAWSSIQYDLLGRITREVSPNGGVMAISYASRPGGGRVTTTVDPLRRRTTVETNTRGLKVLLTDARGKKTRFVSYDAQDKLEAVIGPTGSVAKRHYDKFGRLQRIDDPDLGIRQYSYDPFGDLVSETDGIGHLQTWTYDMLGRTTVHAVNGNSYQYSYVQSGNGSGRINSVSDGTNYQKTFVYDALGRVQQAITSVGSEHFSETTEYDNYGRQIGRTLPGGEGLPLEQVRYVYDAKGYLFKITNGDGSAVYWQLRGTNASGQPTSEKLGNGLITSRVFDGTTGSLKESSVRNTQDGGRGHPILDLTLSYDQAGNLKSRRETSEGVAESFAYDELDRLVGMNRADGSKEVYRFDDAGRMTFKTGVGSFAYRPSGAPGKWQPADTPEAIVSGGASSNLDYDANGNLIKGPNGTYQYTEDNELASVAKDASHYTQFDYDPFRSKMRERNVRGNITTEKLYLDDYERTVEYAAGFNDLSHVERVRHRYYIDSPSGSVAAIDILVERPTGGAGGMDPAPGRDAVHSRTWYLYTDQLGSILKITDSKGKVAASFWYDPWGKAVISKYDNSIDGLDNSWSRGFEGQSYLDDFTLVHMNGRVYDDNLGMFVSPDPAGEPFGEPQSLNRFAFAMDNPLRYTDPSGLWGLGDVWHTFTQPFVAAGRAIGDAANAIGSALNDAGVWIGQNWREVVIVAAAVAVTYFTAGLGSGIGYAILAGAAGGATSGALSAALYGGSFSDVLEGAFRGGLYGAISGATGGMFGASTEYGSILAHGVTEGAISAVQGGGFVSGFAAGAVGQLAADYVPDFDNSELNIARSAIIGGSVAEIGGGKFTNGAISGAMSYIIFNAAGRTGPAAGDPNATVAFIGGAADSLTKNVYQDYLDYIATPGNGPAVYFTWDQDEAVASWIDSHDDEPISVYAHSFGADTAVAAAYAGHYIDNLVTGDPVSWVSANTSTAAGNIGNWQNNYVSSRSVFNFSDVVSTLGGAWNSVPAANDNTALPVHHGDSCALLGKAACHP